MRLAMMPCSHECEELELELPSEPPSVARARKAAADLAAAVGAPVADVKLAVSEAVGNAVLHAFRDRDSGTVCLRARADRGRLFVTVVDDGTGMRPNLDSPGLGLGLSLITKLAADVRFDSSERGTTVSMSFPLGGGEER
jgi:anti-sigma regulatory factor (Ser/Thr protein kinase)